MILGSIIHEYVIDECDQLNNQVIEFLYELKKLKPESLMLVRVYHNIAPAHVVVNIVAIINIILTQILRFFIFGDGTT